MNPDGVFAMTSPTASDKGDAFASTESAKVSVVNALSPLLGSLLDITAEVLESKADVRCVTKQGGGLQPALSGSSRIANLKVGSKTIFRNDGSYVEGTGVVDANGTVHVDVSVLGIKIGTLHINQQTVVNGELTQQALILQLLPQFNGVDLVISEAKADHHGAACGS
jgi:hypothetical protein